MKKDELLHFVVLPVSIGLIGAFSAVLFRDLIKLFEDVYGDLDFLRSSLFYLIVIPVLFVFTYLIIENFVEDDANISLDNIAKKIVMKHDFVYKKGLFSLFLTSLNIGMGVPVGREAPIAKLGGILSDIFLKLVKISRINFSIYLGAGVAAAISATFNAPLAGIILAIEIIVGKINSYIIIPIIVACVTATAVSRDLIGNFAAFYVPHLADKDVYVYIVPVESAFFVLISLFLTFSLDFFNKLKIKYKRHWKKAVFAAGVFVGLLIALVPQDAGVGYNFVTLLFKDQYSFHFAFIVMLVKIIAVVLTLGVGIFGGLMSPSIFIGAFGGYFLGEFFVDFGADPRVLALVGSAAMLAGISKAPLRSSVIIIELTHSYQLLLPTLIASSITSFFVSKFEPGYYFNRSLLQKGIDVSNPCVIDFLRHANVRKYVEFVEPLKEEEKIGRLYEKFKKHHTRLLPVVKKDGEIVGVVSIKDLKAHHFEKNAKVGEIMSKNLFVLNEDATLDDLIKALSIINYHYIPFVSKGDYKGMLNLDKLYHDIIYAQKGCSILKR